MARLEIPKDTQRGDVSLKTWTVRVLQRQLCVNATTSTMRLFQYTSRGLFELDDHGWMGIIEA